jgi:hypothetical protein
MPDLKKMDFYLKKEIEEYKIEGNKKIRTKKDLMIKMLIDEVDR